MLPACGAWPGSAAPPAAHLGLGAAGDQVEAAERLCWGLREELPTAWLVEERPRSFPQVPQPRIQTWLLWTSVQVSPGLPVCRQVARTSTVKRDTKRGAF